ncbi:MAG TPA: N-acetylmuramoyl-L-alanine amidase, partial [Candidatus Sulfotelmatobacter sp.]|nr:N-acetylmuramoyl-L-alanine amidase [Candidatus Sulfotelmatobacter sp.]
PGHGGDDPGALSHDNKEEKVLTLQTARVLARLLREAGANVCLTRDEDRRSNLRDIAAFANRSGADIFISLHYNSTYDPRLSGSETYYYNPVSRRFAETLHEAVVRGLGRRDRGLHRVPFYVVKNTEMPSVLLEPVYLTDPEESGLAASPRFQAELAETVVKGVETYFRDRVR